MISKGHEDMENISIDKKNNFGKVNKNKPLNENVFLYSLEKSALDSKLNITKKTNKLSAKYTSSNSIGKNRKKKGVSIKDILEGNFDKDLINEKIRINPRNNSFVKNYNHVSDKILPSKGNLINITKDKETLLEKNSSKIKNKSNITHKNLINYKNKNANKILNVIPTGKPFIKFSEKKKVEDNFYDDDW